jgi:hypothetical protein
MPSAVKKVTDQDNCVVTLIDPWEDTSCVVSRSQWWPSGRRSVAAAGAQAKNATLTLTEGSVAAGIGFTWGTGTLTYDGKTYPVKVEGLSVGDVGITRATATGTVSNLAKLKDFSGNYVAVGAGATAAGGAGLAVMRNQNGVVLELTSTTQGASLKLAAEGVRLTLAN